MLVGDQRWPNIFNEVHPVLIAVAVYGASTLEVWACNTMTFIKGIVHSEDVVLSSMKDIQDTDHRSSFLILHKNKILWFYQMYSATDIIKLIDFLIDNIFAMFFNKQSECRYVPTVLLF
jgi:hypothetical protein